MAGEEKAGRGLFEVSSWEFDDRTVFGNLRVAWSELSPLDDTSRKEVFLLPKDLALFIFHIFIEAIFQRVRSRGVFFGANPSSPLFQRATPITTIKTLNAFERWQV